MSITDELRKYAGELETAASRKSEHGFSPAAMKLTAIADRIDEAHERAIADAESCAAPTEGQMEEMGYLKAKEDADGVPILPDDMLTDGKHVYTVTSVTFDSFGVTVHGHSETSLNSWPIDQPSKLRHYYHTPTVEDVLRKFTDAILEWAGKSGSVAEVGTWSDVAAEYAAKLRLKED